MYAHLDQNLRYSVSPATSGYPSQYMNISLFLWPFLLLISCLNPPPTLQYCFLQGCLTTKQTISLLKSLNPHVHFIIKIGDCSREILPSDNSATLTALSLSMCSLCYLLIPRLCSDY